MVQIARLDMHRCMQMIFYVVGKNRYGAKALNLSFERFSLQISRRVMHNTYSAS